MTTWTESIAAFDRWQAAADRSPETRKLRRFQLHRAARDLGGEPWAVTADQLTEWIGSRGWSADTIRSHRVTLREFWGWAVTTGLADTNPAAALPSVRPGHHLPRPAVEHVWRAAADSSRSGLIVRLGAQCGLRRSEIARAHSDDIVQRIGGGWQLRILGKGRRERSVPLPPDLAADLRALPEGWVFPSPQGGHLTPAHVGKLARQAMGDQATTHQLRHRYATAVYGGTHDLLLVQSLLGHAKPETTQGYVALSRDDDGALSAAA